MCKKIPLKLKDYHCTVISVLSFIFHIHKILFLFLHAIKQCSFHTFCNINLLLFFLIFSLLNQLIHRKFISDSANIFHV